MLKRFLRQDCGQDLIEYSLLLAFMALSTAGLMINSGTDISTIWSSANSVLSQAAPASPHGSGGHHHGGDGD